MNPYELRGKQIEVIRAEVYPSSSWDVKPQKVLKDASLILYGIILAKRTREARRQGPYVYISSDPDSATGIWLEESDYEIHDN